MQLLHPLTSRPHHDGLIMPRLMLEQSARDMIATYVKSAAHTEINGFAYVTQLNPGVFYVASAADVFITQQTVGAGSAHVTGAAYALAVDRAVENDRVNELRLQWHSHPGDAYFSPTDMSNVENFGRAGGEWFISLVTNRDGDTHARFDMYRPVRFGAEMTVGVYREADPAMEERAATDIAAMVKTIQPPRSKTLRGKVTARNATDN